MLLVAGDSLGTSPPSQAGKVTVAAGTASPGGEYSSLQLLDTNPSGTGGHILLSSTGNIVLQAPVIATVSSTFGTAASDTFLVNAAATFEADTSVAASLAAHGDVTLGASSSQLLTVNAESTFHSPTTFTSTAPISASAAIAATNAVTVGGLLTATGNTALGIDDSQTLTVNASANFNAPVVFSANAPVTASSNMSIGTNSSQALMVQASSTFLAPVVANAAVTIAAGNALSALGNATIGSSNANSLMVRANTTFAGSATFSQAFQLYSNSGSPGSGVVLGFQRQNSGGVVGSGFTLGSILFSGYDGVVQGPTAQIRSVFTVWRMCHACSELLHS